MSRIKTLSEEIDLSVDTSGLIGQYGQSGYVYNKIYQDGIGVFSGQSYVTEGTNLIVNINDIASQNEYKKDYLKLGTNGELSSEAMQYNMIGVYNVKYRFQRGAISTYKVRLDGNDNHNETNIEVLCGYDYESKELRPKCVRDLQTGEDDTSLCRLMTGCNWVWNHSEEIGNFSNIPNDFDALPHYPYIKTDKYGIGLSLNHPGENYISSYCNTEFSLRLTTGQDFNLGMTPFVSSNTTFTTLNNFLSFVSGSETYNSSIYLKLSGTSGDEFGDYEEGYTLYKGHVNLSAIQVSGFKDGVETDLGTFDEGATFNVYIRRYINAAHTGWDYQAISSGNRELYVTPWVTNRFINILVDDYESQYEPTEIPRSATPELYYDELIATPIFSETYDTQDIPDKYNGNCVIGILDKCPARYYLAWNDRYGDMQSQPFEGKVVYSEDIKSEEIKDYKERRRVSHKSIQPKWDLNTKWIKEDVYPIYESIFTSPYVLLYDTEQDKAWNVIVTSKEYEEKTRKNEKSLFNLELKVEACKTNELTY